MKTTFYNFRKVYLLFIFLIVGMQFGLSQIDADISMVSVSPATGPYYYGQKITYVFNVTNNSIAPYDITKVVLRDHLPAGLQFQQADNSLTYVDVGGGVMEASSNDFIASGGGSHSYSIVLTVVGCGGGINAWQNKIELYQFFNGISELSLNDPDNHTNAGDDWENAAEISVFKDLQGNDKTGQDFDSTNDQIRNNDPSLDEPDFDPAGMNIFDLAIKKTITTTAPTFDYGQTIDFKVEIFNQGNLDAKDIVIEEEAIPCGFQFDVAANPDWTYDPVNRNATYTYTGTLAPGATAELSVKMKVWDCHNSDWQNSWKNNIEIKSAKEGNGTVHTTDIDSNYDNDPNNDLVVDDATLICKLKITS